MREHRSAPDPITRLHEEGLPVEGTYPYIRTARPAEVRFWEKVDKNGPIPDERPDLGPCWLWLAAKNDGGYGQFAGGKAHRWAYTHLIGPVPAGLQLDHLCRVRHCVNPAHLEPVTQRENLMRAKSWAAENAAKTHCPRGHAYDEANTLVTKIGHRLCRACARERMAAKKAAMTPEERAAYNARQTASYHDRKPPLRGYARGERVAGAVLTADDVRALRVLRSEGMPRKALAARFGVSEATVKAILAGRIWAWLD